MAYEYRLIVTASDSADAVLAGSFDSQNWDLLQRYLRAVYDLLETRYVKNGMPASLHISWQKESGLTIDPKLPDWEEVMVFLHRFRPVGLQSEATYFSTVANLLKKELVHPSVRRLLDNIREQFRDQTGYTFEIDGTVVNSEDILGTWLNAYEYHRDQDKQKIIDDLHRSFPLDATKVLFLTMLRQKMIAVRNLAAFTRVVVGEQERFQGKISIERQVYSRLGSQL